MLWWFKRHSTATIERVVAAFPPDLAADVDVVLQALPLAKHEPTANDGIEARVCGESLRIPYRVYFPLPSARALKRLSGHQRHIMAALLTRHHDGYVREAWVREVLPSPASWVPAFVVPLLGEYVAEVARAVLQRMPARREAYTEFAAENHELCRKTSARMINYWALYYRRATPRFSDYPGYQAARALGVWQERPPRKRHAR